MRGGEEGKEEEEENKREEYKNERCEERRIGEGRRRRIQE